MEYEYVTDLEKEYFFSGRELPKLYREYLEYLRSEKNSASATVVNYKRPVLVFLTKSSKHSTPAGILRLKPSQVQDYITKAAASLSKEGKRITVTSLRDFFRFLFLKNYTRKDLSKSVPTIITYRMSSLHRGVPWKVVKELLKAPDRRKHRGRRDYCIFLMFARYGVRAGQVIDLRLKDIDWKKKTIRFKAMKGGKEVLGPLFPDVAAALIAYFKGGRMRAAKYDQVFLTTGKFARDCDQRPLGRALWYLVSRQLARLGYDRSKPTPRGPHAIRHAFATRLLEKNQPMKTISDLLGHESLRTTYVYTKSDMKMLRRLMVPWPLQEAL